MVLVSTKEGAAAKIERVTCPSKVTEVVVYARGAVVTRRIDVPGPLAGTAIDLVVEAITPLAEPGSFRVEAEGDREVLGVVTELEIPEDDRTEGELERDLEELRRTIAGLEAKRVRREARRSAIARAHPTPRLTRKKGFSDPGARTRNVLRAQALLGELEEGLDKEIVALDRELSDRRKELERLSSEAAQREGSAVAKKHHPELRAVIRLAEGDAPVRGLLLSYAVAEARWWPTYAVHLTGGARNAELFVDALVAQATFEDWKDVKLALSTADLVRDVRLPELTSLRLGRAQPPAKRGFREPPPDLDALFTGYDEARAAAVRKPAPIPPALRELRGERPEPPALAQFEEEEITGAGWAAESYTRAGTISAPGRGIAPLGATAPRSAPPPPRLEAPVSMARAAAPTAMFGSVLEAAADGIAALAESEVRSFKTIDPSAIEPADAWLDFDSLRLGTIDDARERGRLVRVRRLEITAKLVEEVRLVDVTSTKLRDPLATRGVFDHRYDAEGTAEVPANGRAHRVSLMRAKAGAKPRFVTVPRKVADVFREVELTNPLEAPLLLGPIDVMLDGALLTTTVLEEPVDRGASFAVGLGVEERVRVARNARVRETTTGMLSTSTSVEHQVTIDLVSGLGHPVAIEIFERVPITDDKSIKVELIESSPPAERYDQKERGRPIDGGIKWKVPLDPGAKRTVSFTYRIELPAKSEIQGGNRRE